MPSINNRNNPLLPFLSQLPAETAEQVAPRTSVTARPLTKAELQEQAERLEAPPRKASAADMERLAAQAGFSRTGRKNKRGFDLDDNSQAPIPLPVDEVDETAWEQRTLDDAQEELTLQSRELKHLAEEVADEGAGELGIFGRLVRRTFTGADSMERLQTLADAPSQEQVALGQVQSSIQAMFGITLGEVANGPALVAAALVVAGLPEAVQPEAGSLEAVSLSQGMQKLVENSNTAVNDARSMSSGINKQLAVHRTFMFKK